MGELARVVGELWATGVGPDDRARVAALRAELATAELSADEAALRDELAVFAALCELTTGGQAVVPKVDPLAMPFGSARVLAAAARVWSAAAARDPDRLATALDQLEPLLAELARRSGPRVPIVTAWADLALAEAALISADRSTARRRFDAVARSAAPVALRITATLRGVTLLVEKLDLAQALELCRSAVTLATTAGRPLHAQQARIAEAVLAYLAGDRETTRAILTAESCGPLGLLPRILLASFEPAERAMPLLADGLADAGARGDAIGFTVCTIVGAHRYAALGRDPDALLTLSAAIPQLREVAPGCALALDEQREALRRDWGPARYAAAEQAALALLDGR